MLPKKNRVLSLVLAFIFSLWTMVGCAGEPGGVPSQSSALPSASDTPVSEADASDAESGTALDTGYLAAAAWITTSGSGYGTLLRVKSTGALVFTPYVGELAAALNAGDKLSDYRCLLRFTLLGEDGAPCYTYPGVETEVKQAGVANAFDFYMQEGRTDCGFCPTAGKCYNILLVISDREGTPVWFGNYDHLTVPADFARNSNYRPTEIPEVLAEAQYTLHYVALGGGGRLIGEVTQTLRVGEKATPVTATGENARFIRWSDGSTDAERRDDRISCDSWIYAYFVSDAVENHGIPALQINIGDGSVITDTVTWKDCTLSAQYCGKDAFSGISATVRGRGNGSWSQDSMKKPMKLKLSKKRALLGLGGKAKDWVLIPQAGDPTFLRYLIALRMAGQLSGIDYASECRLTEVYLNGNYYGVYLLAEQVEVQKNRVAVDDQGDETELGYLVELDRYASGEGAFEINGEEYEVKSEWRTVEQLRSIISRVRAVDQAIRRGKRAAIERLVDLDSLVDTYLLHEYLKNTDTGWSSFYMYADKGGKLFFGAPWDFDLSQGNDPRFRDGAWDGFDAGTGYDAGYDQDNEWFKALWKQDWFRTLAAERWYEISADVIPAVLADAKATAAEAVIAIQADYRLYRPGESNSYDGYLSALFTWHRQRKRWLDQNFKVYL